MAPLHADQRYLYFVQHDVWRVDLGRPQPEGAAEREFFFKYGFGVEAGSDGENFYGMSASQVLRVNLESKTESPIPLDWDHSASNGLLVTDEYVYAAMPGCAALTRIDKKTLEKTVMYIDGISYPGRGSTVLAGTGNPLVCASPSNIFAIDRWAEPARNLQAGNRELFGAVVVDEQVYWLEQPVDENTAIGAVPLAGGPGGIVARSDSQYSSRLLYAPSIDKLVWDGHLGPRAFDLQSHEIRALALTNGRGVGSFDIALSGEHLFVTVDGSATCTVDRKPQAARANWIARVPLVDLR